MKDKLEKAMEFLSEVITELDREETEVITIKISGMFRETKEYKFTRSLADELSSIFQDNHAKVYKKLKEIENE